MIRWVADGDEELNVARIAGDGIERFSESIT